MKKFLLMLFIVATTAAYGQGKTLFVVNAATPKGGQGTAFETAWKLHLAKFHNTTDKRTVFQILSGPHNGSFLLIEGPVSFADMDIEKPNAKEHRLDLEKTIVPREETGGANEYFRWADTLSYNPDVKAEKYIVTVTHIKNGRMADYLSEVRKAVLLNTKANNPTSYNNYVKIWAGSDPVIVNVRNLKDGFKELDAAYGVPMTPGGLKDAYIRDYGQAAWDTRMKNGVDDVTSREVYIMKVRKDLSSK